MQAIAEACNGPPQKAAPPWRTGVRPDRAQNGECRVRRRRRRRGGGGISPRMLQIAGGVGALALVAGFFFFLNAADRAVPAREEVRVALPDAFATKAASSDAQESESQDSSR